MKKFLSLLLVMLLSVNYASSQTTSIASKIVKTWVLQNPEYAVYHTVATFYTNGQILLQVSNLLNKEKSSVKLFWKLDEKNRIISITTEAGETSQMNVIINDNTLTLINRNNNEIVDYFAESGSKMDYYMSRVQFAIDTYGVDASLRKNGMASSSRESGYSFQPRYSNCSGCFGLGRCTYCSGAGRTTYNFRDYVTCPSCHGTGVCYLCQGKGKIKNY